MAHITSVGGTAYEISGGKTLIGGTEYNIEGGKTCVGNTMYDVSFGGRVIDGEIKDSWRSIASGKYLWAYSIGNWKPITLSNGETIIMEIVAMGADEKEDGSTANITWISRGIVTTHVMNSQSNSAKVWADSDLRTWLQGDFYDNYLPSNVKSAITKVNKTYYNILNSATRTVVDNVWIPSYREIIGGTTAERSGTTYTSYFNNASSRIKYDFNGIPKMWWLRSIYSTSAHYRYISESGTTGNALVSAEIGVVLGFCT